MRNNRRTLGIIIIALGFIILALLLYLSFFVRPSEGPEPVTVDVPPITGQLPPSQENTEPTVTPNEQPRNYQKYDITQEEEHEVNEQDLIKISQAFAERFGSYSNYSNYSNFSDLKIFMTEEMKIWADKYVEELRSSSQGATDYYGVTTNAITSEVLSFNDNSGSAAIMVTTQRRESTSQVNEGSAYIQDIQITLKRLNGEWLVDKAYWQEK